MTIISMITIPLFINIILVLIYMLLILFSIIRILLDTHSSSKTLAYILLVIVLPFVGLIIYFSFGINNRHTKTNNKLIASMNELESEFKIKIVDQKSILIKNHPNIIRHYSDLVRFLHKIGNENLCKNEYKLLVNGEEKFPELLKTLETAKHFIHMEYYSWENDIRGNQIKEVLLKKMRQGIKIRIMYDAYASRKIKNNIVKELKAGGVDIYPVIKIKIVKFASRVNHRDHRKVIIVDGLIGFIGGINISDRYDNSIDTGLYWRDTHLKITGATVLDLQRHFIINWNSCQPNKLSVTKDLFPDPIKTEETKEMEFAQLVAGGPVYPLANIMLTYFKIFSMAREKIYITNPYFIPNDSILDALKQAAISGVDVRLMIPDKSDSLIVGAASKFYFSELLQAGVKIFMYKKGFIHAKTVVVDTNLSIVGTANMDIRSFDLNFEIMAVIYGTIFAKQLEKEYLKDLNECYELNYEDWIKQGIFKQLSYSMARLISSFL